VRQSINVECEADVFLGGVEDVLTAGYAGIVDEDCGLADIFADGGCDGCDLIWGGDIAFVVVNVLCYMFISAISYCGYEGRTSLESHRNNIYNNDFNPFLS